MNAGPIGEVAEPEDRVFKALGHRDRRRLLRLIADGEVPVGLLAERSELDQPVVSQHLRVLRTAGLVTVRIDNNRRLYSIDFARFAELRGFLDLFWQEKLALLKQVAETPARAGVASAASARSTAVERVDR
ncbi:MAG: metalloregulator ArsR/SmtB family transcription factor [Actinomycetota bacterium]|nr:metalloregulator ArsR/SmtB family transcription factor [Actinomycetota bacterium]